MLQIHGGRRPSFWKPINCNSLTDFDEISHGDAHWSLQCTSHKNFEFLMVAAAILKITKIAISLQRFDWSLWNLVRCCKTGLLTFQVVENFNFTNPRHLARLCNIRSRPIKLNFKNPRRRTAPILKTVKSPYLCNLILIKFGTMMPSAWRKVQIFNFRQSYMTDRHHLTNQKNCFNILCNNTITHYKISQQKQQILILKTAVYPLC